MKSGSFGERKRKSIYGMVKEQKPRPVMFALIFLCPFLASLCGFCPMICLASGQDSIPLPQKDKAFGETCPPGFCRIPQGFMMGLRDMPLGVYFIDNRTGWVVGDFGLVLKTEDGGGSWQDVDLPDGDEDSYKDVFFVRDKGWIVGERGVILHTDDGGKNWEKQTSNIRKNLLSVCFIDGNRGFTVGGDGTIIKTETGGSSWQVVDMDWDTLIPEALMEIGVISINLYDVFFLNETSGWIVGDAGTVLRTLDGGKNWSLAQMVDSPPLFSVYFENDMQGWAVGAHGFSLKTDDGGQRWEKVKIGTENSLYKIVFYHDYGVIVGDLATVLKTVDGGRTWVKVPANLPPPYPWFADVWLFPTNPVRALAIGKSIIFNTEITSKR